MESFVYAGPAARVVFGPGTLSGLRDEVDRLGATRVLLLGGRADRAADVLGPLVGARFEGVAMHTPVGVTEGALELVGAHDVDCLVSVGGGSSTGLGKALTARTGLPLVAVPTTYSGSEMTPILGETADGKKTTRRDPALAPRTVIYDVELTLGMPVGLTVTSGLNAMAHAVEALYSPGANPATDNFALEAITRLGRALPRLAERPDDPDARADALLGAWLAGICLGTVGMGLHHKLCHVLGGTYGLPHSETHAVLLPHVMAASSPAAMGRIAAALGATDAPTAVFDLATRLGAPGSLVELGLAEGDLPAIAGSDPRVLAVLEEAWRGDRPAPLDDRPDLSALTEQVVASFTGAANPRTAELLGDLVRRLHGFVVDNDLTEAEWLGAIDFLTRTGRLCSPTRQEFVLLSDTLGISSAVDLLTNSRSPDTTPSAVLGPFYVEGPPAVPSGANLAEGLPGVPLRADVRITDLDGRPIADAVVDVWQSNQDGFYDVQLPELEGPVLRARLRSAEDGTLWFRSILPSEYPIPDDGPVGQMLRATGRHPYRAPHLHFMISAPGHRKLITQLFVAGGRYLDSDAVFGVKDDLIVEFPPAADGSRTVEFTFRLGAANG
ncbi:maleylacetate reductase and hydroxyquinol 1,2-dioxygenase domain-containing protein [Actinoplanes sp. TRM 88003]|uniref:Maleylacetate reductase and hydroxyquinol 1,2-dioxygenase domain-containing protein n=1 Tax=Paractinoplanes aksuensis TaxID=2939490 RepID=A0ABT1DN84_9ACTN|nr:maleylacetate reductase and hydroxyquinol 1,2-dioxygenase domain-containing protein [Actinoplanes aksuensis]MCO8271933.1 maleylacetate reductase and hydroxyquinol 1,2-dioxygenase domain-containing protein [Actinoplanes aksuensis]